MQKLRLSKLRDHVRVSYNTWGFKGMLNYYRIYLYQEMHSLRVFELATRLAGCTKAVVLATWGMYEQAGFLSAFWFVCPFKIVTIEEDGEKLLMYFKPRFEKMCGQWVYYQEINPRRLCTLRKPRKARPALDSE